MRDVWAAASLGTISESDVHEALTQRLDLDDVQRAHYMTDMWREYVGTANQELIEFARGLRPRYRTGILSNSFVGAREREQALYGFEQLVDEIVYSHEIGMRKPDPRIYQFTCARLGCQPAETIFIDNVEANVQAAADAGLRAVHFRDNAQALKEVAVLLGT